LNPVEAVWNWLKWGRLANFVPDDLQELDDWVVEYLIELKHDPELLRALWERSDLPFPDHRRLKSRRYLRINRCHASRKPAGLFTSPLRGRSRAATADRVWGGERHQEHCGVIH
jgi:hypothetical protein